MYIMYYEYYVLCILYYYVYYVLCILYIMYIMYYVYCVLCVLCIMYIMYYVYCVLCVLCIMYIMYYVYYVLNIFFLSLHLNLKVILVFGRNIYFLIDLVLYFICDLSFVYKTHFCTAEGMGPES